jgi:hypothetical protein
MTASYVKLSAVPQDAGRYITPDMVKAKASCRKCRGKGTRGHLCTTVFNPPLKKYVAAGTALPCTCLVVDVVALKYAIEEARSKQMEADDART